jgi:hypothetical protein
VRMLKRAADVPANFAHSTCPRTWCRSFRCCYWLENSLILIDLGTFILVLPSKPSPNRFDLVTNLVIWCAARHGFTPIGLPERIKFQNRSYILVICRFYCSDRDALRFCSSTEKLSCSGFCVTRIKENSLMEFMYDLATMGRIQNPVAVFSGTFPLSIHVRCSTCFASCFSHVVQCIACTCLQAFISASSSGRSGSITSCYCDDNPTTKPGKPQHTMQNQKPPQ